MAQLSPLRRGVIEDMAVRNLSPATQRSYSSAVAKFSRYFGRSPDKLELEDVRAFQVHLVATGISWQGLNQIVYALRFFYGVTLGQPTVPERIPYAREPSKLPVVLSADEVVCFLEAVSSLKSRAAPTTAYAAGLRASEVAGLRVEDIDSGRGVIQMRHGPFDRLRRRQGSHGDAVASGSRHMTPAIDRRLREAGSRCLGCDDFARDGRRALPTSRASAPCDRGVTPVATQV